MTIKGTITRVLLFFILLLPLAQLFSMGTVVSRVWGIPLNIAPTVSFILCLCVCVCVCVLQRQRFQVFHFSRFFLSIFSFRCASLYNFYFICSLEPSVSLRLPPPLSKGGKNLLYPLAPLFKGAVTQ